MNRTGSTVYVLAFALALGIGAFAAIAGDMDCVKMSGGKMITMQSGKPNAPMDHEMTMSDGTIVGTDGSVRFKDGKVMHLQNGEMVMMDGHIMRGGKAAAMSR